MADLTQFFGVKIGENVSLADLITNPSRHSWRVSFEFPSDEYRNPRATPNGKKYGSNESFAQIYRYCKQRFLDIYFETDFFYSSAKEKGDELLANFNTELGVDIESYTNKQGEVFKINKNYKINEKRYTNIVTKLDNYRKQLNLYESKIIDLKDNLPRTKKGAYDRRTVAFHQFQKLLSERYELKLELETLDRRVKIEKKRFENSSNRSIASYDKLQGWKENLVNNIAHKYEYMAEDFAREVKTDILSLAECGILPMQNIALLESTIKSRKYAGLPSKPRYWATGQLIRSIKIICTLV